MAIANADFAAAQTGFTFVQCGSINFINNSALANEDISQYNYDEYLYSSSSINLYVSSFDDQSDDFPCIVNNISCDNPDNRIF